MKFSKALYLPLALCLGFGQLAFAASNPEAVKRTEAGAEYYRRNQFEAARDQFLEALKLDPGFAEVHYNLGMLYFYKLNDFERALYHFNMYRRLEPQSQYLERVFSHAQQSLEKIEEKEKSEYKIALSLATVSAFEEFVAKYPVGYYSDSARAEIKKIKEYNDKKTMQDNKVKEAFSSALAEKTPEAMDKFITNFPDSAKTDEARKIRDQLLEAREREKKAFDSAMAEETPEALFNFVDKNPSSKLVEQAKKRAAHLESAKESITIARESGQLSALEKFLEVYGDTPQAAEAHEIIEELKKAKVENAATSEALKALDKKIEEPQPPVAPVPAPPLEKAASPAPAPAVTKTAPPKAPEPEPVKPDIEKYRKNAQKDEDKKLPTRIKPGEKVPDTTPAVKAPPKDAGAEKSVSAQPAAKPEQKPMSDLELKVKQMKEAEAKRQEEAKAKAERMKEEEAKRKAEAEQRAQDIKKQEEDIRRGRSAYDARSKKEALEKYRKDASSNSATTDRDTTKK